MILLDGKKVSSNLKDELKRKAEELKSKYNVTPKLSIVLVGANPASLVYVKNKVKACEYTGITPDLINVSEEISEEDLLNLVDKLNKDDSIHGIIVQLPLPKHINEQKVIDAICKEKDVDGFGIENKGRLFCGLDSLHSATPEGIITLLDAYNIPIQGKHAVVVGRSNIVGKPIAMLLLSKNATVTITHSKTTDLGSITKLADISVWQRPNRYGICNVEMRGVKDGAIVIDVGINRIEGKLYGDVDFENVAPKTSYITPVPGGVGPLTIASLLKNTLIAYERILNK